MRHWRHRRSLHNRRSELAAVSVGTNRYGYAYDTIGNRLWSAENSVTNSYAANSLNQYTQFAYDLDGNMTQCGGWAYTYDADNRLKSASSNGVTLVTNFYDAKSRRVKKVTSEATTTFFYDGWNLIEERIAYTNGTTTTIRYFWGKDLSGTLQGAGGVGGLLYLTIDGVPYVPNYDNIGNVTRYLDANGNTVAQYTYDVFGKTIAQTGALADVFRFRFSTKYFDTETGLYFYGYRFYHPLLMRWINRDPIEADWRIPSRCANLFAYGIVAVLGMTKYPNSYWCVTLCPFTLWKRNVSQGTEYKVEMHVEVLDRHPCRSEEPEFHESQYEGKDFIYVVR